MLKRILYGAAVALAATIGVALAAAGPTTVINLWNPGGLHGVAPGLAGSDGTNIAPGVSLYTSSGAPNDATHPLYHAPAINLADPCQNPNVAKSSAVINIGAAATTKIVDTSASKTVYVCSFHLTLAGTTPTLVFKTGTHTTNDCDTAAVSLSGTYAPTTGSVLAQTGAGVLMQSTAGGQLCGTTAGSGSSAQGLLTFVQQ